MRVVLISILLLFILMSTGTFAVASDNNAVTQEVSKRNSKKARKVMAVIEDVLTGKKSFEKVRKYIISNEQGQKLNAKALDLIYKTYPDFKMPDKDPTLYFNFDPTSNLTRLQGKYTTVEVMSEKYSSYLDTYPTSSFVLKFDAEKNGTRRFEVMQVNLIKINKRKFKINIVCPQTLSI